MLLSMNMSMQADLLKLNHEIGRLTGIAQNADAMLASKDVMIGKLEQTVDAKEKLINSIAGTLSDRDTTIANLKEQLAHERSRSWISKLFSR